MVILGLLLLAAAGVVGTEMAISNPTGVPFEVFGNGYTVPVYAVFLLGALLMTVAILGAFMITGALQRRRVVRHDAKHRVRVEDYETRVAELERSNAELIAENDRLNGVVADHERAVATMGGVAVPPGVGDVAYGDQVSDAVRSNTITDTGRFDPYPTEGGTVSGAAVNTEAARDDAAGTTGVTGTDRTDDKAGVVGRFRNT